MLRGYKNFRSLTLSTLVMFSLLLTCLLLLECSVPGQQSLLSKVSMTVTLAETHQTSGAVNTGIADPHKEPKRCNLDGVNEWTKSILGTLSVKCGLEQLKSMALEFCLGNGRTDVAFSKLRQTIVGLHAALKPTFYAVKRRKWAKTNQTKVSPPTSKSLSFIKAYKVGGTHISSLLITHAYNNDLNIDRTGHWSIGSDSQKKYPACVDIAGTNHPEPNFYTSVTRNYTKQYFCNDLLTFMFIRDPIQRIWSAYNHYRRTYATSIVTFLVRNHVTLTPPHFFLSRSLDKAIELSDDIDIYSQDDMDMSLVMLATKAGLGMCDIMSEPCRADRNSWGVSKCNDKKTVLKSNVVELISKYVNSTGEKAFYDKAIVQFKERASDPSLRRKVDKYLTMRNDSLRVCSSDLTYKAFENIFFADPMVGYSYQDSHWVFAGEEYYQIVPTWVCMQAYCRHTIGDDFEW